jgi:hypothetical protein
VVNLSHRPAVDTAAIKSNQMSDEPTLAAAADCPVALLGAALLLGSSFWLDQSAQLKQYTLDVLVALLPFTLGDNFFEESLAKGARKRRPATGLRRRSYRCQATRRVRSP